MKSELFAQGHHEIQTNERWVKQSKRMLRVNVTGTDVIAAKGSMVAYQGQIQFHHEGAGSFGKLMKKMLTSEGAPLMRMQGQGEVFLARDAQEIFTVQLENEGLTVNGSSLLAFDHSLQWDIKMLRGGGFMAGGLFNLEIGGHGTIALSCDGDPLLLDCSQQPTYVDPNAAVCWSHNLEPKVVNSMNMRSMLRGGTGEAFQLAFHGPGFVIVQPSEGRVQAQASGGGGGLTSLLS